jgi:hypothetical protein
MKSIIGLVSCLTVIASSLAATNSPWSKEEFRRVREGPFVKLGNIPALSVSNELKATASETAQIKQHIANLAKIEKPDFGLSATMSSTAFAPVRGEQHGGGFLLTNHRLETTDDVRALVELGPKTLPMLLPALDDNTSTRLKMMTEEDSSFVMHYSNELDGNPTNAIEQKAISALPKLELFGETVTNYTVKVGDVCFAIIGQIVGRSYLAVRYQPSGIIIINSPTHDKLLAKQVRTIWASTNATQRLFDSLLFDYATEGIVDPSLDRAGMAKTLQSLNIASALQSQAAMRMLYYFPRETSGMLAERLARLNVQKSGNDITNYIAREVTNGVRAEEFIKALAWSDQPLIRREVLNIFKRTTDIKLLLGALPVVGTNETALVRSRLNEFIDRLPPDEPGPYGDGYNLLVALGENIGEQAKPTFVRYLENASLQRWRSMSQALRKTQRQWAVELLAPALVDKREFGWTYALVPGQNEPRRPIRVCDEAAETISLSRPDLPFTMAGEHADLDRQIAAMRARILGPMP